MFVRASLSKDWAAGKMPVDLSFLPPRCSIDDARVVVLGTLNVPAAGLAAGAGRRLLDSVECVDIRSSGIGLGGAELAQSGRDGTNPAAIAQNAAAPVEFSWPLSFKDPRQVEPSDHTPATDTFRGKTLDLYFAKPTDILAALAVNAGTQVYVEFTLTPLSAGKTPTDFVAGFVEMIGKEVTLPGGIDYHDVYVAKNDGSTFTDAELGNIRLAVDGNAVLVDRVRMSTLLRRWNRYVAHSNADALSLSAPGFVFLHHPIPPAKGTKPVRAVREVRVSIDGTLAANIARVFYRGTKIRDDRQAQAKATAIWGDKVSSVRPDASVPVSGGSVAAIAS